MTFNTIKKLPILIRNAALIAVTTILVCYILSTFFNHYPSSVILPFISLTGYKAPEYYLYSIGFCITGILFLYCSYHIHFSVLPITELFSEQQIIKLFITLSSGVICFMIHAIIPLQDDIISSTHLTLGSRIHQSCAGIFFMLVIIHTFYIFNILKDKKNVFSYFDERAMNFRKWCCNGCGITIILAMAIHPTTISIFGSVAMKFVVSVAAIAQWILVGFIILIFVSYSMDITKILPRIYEKEHITK
ncbi:hypothetical protein ENU1_041920 [Entamoeba nuttalli P19]|uniref:CWH43-like N-terminal domain-containing protein n=1 Tax=Entamoeba nuttalli (strain P19) TaxID=1076696 RepID=K2H5Z4_ENTNP|nr:hypothetical protein ENU1_041920 [Entamoeba nuttalli P19]EKE41867.1 hypothetical protein ENU1_041920 [Entamoeba nuttalli P19]|eukprot:XP_008855798.1 hypothetical protein ENU1_041920 [Entamoeba nuttalli P19]